MNRESIFLKQTAIVLVFVLLNQICFPTIAAALTGGPSQPEVQGFSPVGSTEMVDLFTGDFSYNIPLLDVDGYPINISYASNPGMDDEASWVGLGWTLNPGSINRNLRGLPDDFKGDKITKETDIKEDKTVGVTVAPRFELFGAKISGGLSLSGGLYYNTYKGFGTEFSISPSISLSKKLSSSFIPVPAIGPSFIPTIDNTLDLNLGTSLSFDAKKELDIGGSIGLGLSRRIGNRTIQSKRLDVSSGISSRRGMRDLTLSASMSNVKIAKESRSLSLGTSLSFSDYTYTPTSDLPFTNISNTFHGSVGGELFGGHGSVNVTGYETRQFIAPEDRFQQQSAYGTLYSKEGSEISSALLDFNRDKQIPYREDMPIIPMPFGTYDLFSVMGQGVSGQFRAAKNDVGVYRDGERFNSSTSITAGVEAGLGNAFHLGVDLTPTTTFTSVTEWKEDDGNNIKSTLKFTENSELYEATYLKGTGERVFSDNDFLEDIGGTDPIKVDLQRTPLTTEVLALNEFNIEPGQRKKRDENGNIVDDIDLSAVTTLQKSNREKRNQVYSFLTAEEAAAVGLDKTIKHYPFNTRVFGDCSPISNPIKELERTVEGFREVHHMSEVTVLQNGGMRYVYGLPVYNKRHKEVTFSVDAKPELEQDDVLTTYTSDGANPDNSVDNVKGDDNYFDAEETPPYAHSFLLTAVLSPDYVDRTGDGITDDDVGNAVKLNYSKVGERSTSINEDEDDEVYSWRVPLGTNTANYNRGYNSDDGDDKASYIYGEKELWYLHSIESRTMLAQFIVNDAPTESRADGIGVANGPDGENGTPATTQQYRRLERIDLYAKADITANGENAIPIKSVHFKYNNELCQGIGNSTTNEGKLTLKEIYFTYGNSNRGQLNAYQFTYSSVNPEYNIGDYDRWGCFKMHPADSGNDYISTNGFTENKNYPNPKDTENPKDFPANKDFPYCLQEKSLTDQYVSAWNLTEILLPSGGKIEVEYESDDYAYVQNKRAAQMTFIEGFAQTADGTITNNLFELNASEKLDYINPWIIFQPVEDYTGAVGEEEDFINSYFQDIEQIYFQCSIRLDDDENHYDYVKGYLKYKDVQYRTEDGKIAMEVDLIDIDGKSVHPISQAAYQTMRVNLPELVYPGYESNGIPGLAGFGNEIKNFFKGFNQNAMLKRWGQVVQPNKSWIRLSNTEATGKLGGGSRVKQLLVSDEWIDPLAEQDAAVNDDIYTSKYGQKYRYIQTVGGSRVSSGVASYEPMLGNEENALRTAMRYDEQFLVAPDNSFYTEFPIGEALYPAPVVGYSEVRVEPIYNEDDYENDNPIGLGETIHKFYTAKDFPTRTDYTSKEPHHARTNPILKILNLDIKDYFSVSQGFVVEVNDMHGKPKETSTYNDYGSLLSSTKYFYKTDKLEEEEEESDNQEMHLTNEVSIVQADGSITTANMGLDVDIWQDMQEELIDAETSGIATNADGFIAFILPALAVVPLPVYTRNRTRFRTSVTTKFIKRYGIIDKVVVTENGSSLETKNLLFDSETGDVLLTRTQNEFNDAMYQFNYPAHWEYEGMEQAYQNIGAIFRGVAINEHGVLPTLYQELFSAGDELMVTESDGSRKKYFIVEAGDGTPTNGSSSWIVMDEMGIPHPETTTMEEEVEIKVIRSGRRNLASVAMGSITSRQEPTNGNSIEIDNSKEIYQATATQFQDIWQMDCEYIDNECGEEVFLPTLMNPYVKAVRGNWRPYETAVFYEDRTENARVNGDIGTTDIRTDGAILNFQPFWTYTSEAEKWSPSMDGRWTVANRATLFDQRGNGLESQDAINVYSSAYFGYNDTRAVAIAANAARNEITNDNFEDYSFDNECNAGSSTRNFSFVDDPATEVTQAVAHTGRYSLVLGANQQKTVKTKTIGCGDPGSQYIGYTTNPTGEAQSTCQACLPRLALEPGKEYAVQLWMATNSTLKYGGLPTSVGISFNFNTNDLPVSFEPTGTIVDGWQRIEGRFTVPMEATEMVVQLTNNNVTETAYVDDFRIHPWNANMKTYVYDPFSMRLWADLDENNYANYYEYDDEGILVRVKRETEKGIVTIQESRTLLQSNNEVEE